MSLDIEILFDSLLKLTMNEEEFAQQSDIFDMADPSKHLEEEEYTTNRKVCMNDTEKGE